MPSLKVVCPKCSKSQQVPGPILPGGLEYVCLFCKAAFRIKPPQRPSPYDLPAADHRHPDHLLSLGRGIRSPEPGASPPAHGPLPGQPPGRPRLIVPSDLPISRDAAPRPGDLPISRDAAPRPSDLPISRDAAPRPGDLPISRDAAPRPGDLPISRDAAPRPGDLPISRDAAPRPGDLPISRDAAPRPGDLPISRDAAPRPGDLPRLPRRRGAATTIATRRTGYQSNPSAPHRITTSRWQPTPTDACANHAPGCAAQLFARRYRSTARRSGACARPSRRRTRTLGGSFRSPATSSVGQSPPGLTRLLGEGPWEGPSDPPRASSVGQSPPELTRLLGEGPWEGPLDPPRTSSVGQSPPELTRLPSRRDGSATADRAGLDPGLSLELEGAGAGSPIVAATIPFPGTRVASEGANAGAGVRATEDLPALTLPAGRRAAPTSALRPVARKASLPRWVWPIAGGASSSSSPFAWSWPCCARLPAPRSC